MVLEFTTNYQSLISFLKHTIQLPITKIFLQGKCTTAKRSKYAKGKVNTTN